jgi:Na+-transporting methylmalonyl-CoA/oxaloacetate decarboxylase gamma subunit
LLTNAILLPILGVSAVLAALSLVLLLTLAVQVGKHEPKPVAP